MGNAVLKVHSVLGYHRNIKRLPALLPVDVTGSWKQNDYWFQAIFTLMMKIMKTVTLIANIKPFKDIICNISAFKNLIVNIFSIALWIYIILNVSNKLIEHRENLKLLGNIRLIREWGRKSADMIWLTLLSVILLVIPYFSKCIRNLTTP